MGGLPDAVGPCGLYFPNGDVEALAAALERALTDKAYCEQLIANGPAHLKSFEPQNVAKRYLDLFQSVTA
jgi:glycosyltransferase involved in cell wall biosynthesis